MVRELRGARLGKLKALNEVNGLALGKGEAILGTVIAAGAGSRGFAHSVKVTVRLVSFPGSSVRNDLLSNRVPPHNVTSRPRRFLSQRLAALRLATPVVAMFSPVRSTRRFPPRYAATTASRQRRA
jgi:hypothetical protein